VEARHRHHLLRSQRRSPEESKTRQDDLPYVRVAQVNLGRSIMTTDLEIVNKGGLDNLPIKDLKKSQPEEANGFIELTIQEAMRRK